MNIICQTGMGVAFVHIWAVQVVFVLMRTGDPIDKGGVHVSLCCYYDNKPLTTTLCACITFNVPHSVCGWLHVENEVTEGMMLRTPAMSSPEQLCLDVCFGECQAPL